MTRCCIIIPVYRHLAPLRSVLAQVEKYALTCFLVDDFNIPPLKEALAAELKGRLGTEILRLPWHSGKGAACVEGSRRALERGFTHAIFIDADNQHDAGDIPRLIALSGDYPQAMLLGHPVFDRSAPFARRFGRFVSNAWVWIETLSFDIQDSLCGFRCFPLAPLVKVASQVQLGKRMDFDPDVVVRLFWEGVPALNFDTQIRYPPDGVSNFNLLRDNVALFWLHTRLVVGMLGRAPALLRGHWRNARRPAGRAG